MTAHRTDIWTYLIITAVTVLIWWWAAGETRVSRELNLRVQFSVGAEDPEMWIMDPEVITITIQAEGSQRAVRNAEQRLRQLIIADMPPEAGGQLVDLARTLRDHPLIKQTGITITSLDPSAIELDMDKIIEIEARVLPDLPGVRTADEILVEPPIATIWMPSRLRRMGEDLTVTAAVDPKELAPLDPGIRHTLENVPLRLPRELSTARNIQITPPAAKVSFTIVSQTREVRLDSPVRVQVLAAPEPDEYLVELDPRQLRDVIVIAPAELAQRIESGEAVVVAILQLKFSEKEARIESKPIAGFFAILPDGTAQPVELKSVGKSQVKHPIIELNITDRSQE